MVNDCLRKGVFLRIVWGEIFIGVLRFDLEFEDLKMLRGWELREGGDGE